MSELSSQLNAEVPCFPIEAPASPGTIHSLYGTACAICGRLLYVDQDTLQRITYATQSGLDNPLRCEVCKEEYDDLVFEG